MTDRFAALGFAVLYVLPVVLAFDAGLRPARAWQQLGRSKWRWTTAFLVPVGLFVTVSVVPALVVLPLSAYYLAKVRSLLSVTTGLARPHDGPGDRTGAGHAIQDRLAGITAAVTAKVRGLRRLRRRTGDGS